MNAYVHKNAWHTPHTPAAQPELERCYGHEYTHVPIPTLHIITGNKSNIITPIHGQQNIIVISDTWGIIIKIIHRPRLDLHFYALLWKCNLLPKWINWRRLALGAPNEVEAVQKSFSRDDDYPELGSKELSVFHSLYISQPGLFFSHFQWWHRVSNLLYTSMCGVLRILNIAFWHEYITRYGRIITRLLSTFQKLLL